jgi:hypothetical protein
MTSYTKWKSWDANQFGLTSKENSLYYKKLFSRYLPEAKNLLEIGNTKRIFSVSLIPNSAINLIIFFVFALLNSLKNV